MFIKKVESISDMQIVASLAKEIWNEYYTAIIGREQVEYMIQNFQSVDVMLNQVNKGYEYFILKYENRYVGYFSFLYDFDKQEIFLSKLYVHKDFRGQGVASKCIMHLEDLYKDTEINRIWLTVNKYNELAITAYEKMGFTNIEATVQDIGNGFIMDDYIMEKKIGQ